MNHAYDGYLLTVTFHEGGNWNTYYFDTAEEAATFRYNLAGWHTALMSKVEGFMTHDGARADWMSE